MIVRCRSVGYSGNGDGSTHQKYKQNLMFEHKLQTATMSLLVFAIKGYEKQHDLVMLDGTEYSEHRNEKQYHSASQKPSDDRQVRHNRGGSSIHSNSDQNERNELKSHIFLKGH